MILEQVTTEKQLLSLYIFMHSVTENLQNNVRFYEYKFMYNNGIAYTINDEDGRVIGGLLIHTRGGINEAFSLYVPSKYRNTWAVKTRPLGAIITDYVCNSESKELIVNIENVKTIKNSVTELPRYGKNFYKIKNLCKDY